MPLISDFIINRILKVSPTVTEDEMPQVAFLVHKDNRYRLAVPNDLRDRGHLRLRFYGGFERPGKLNVEEFCHIEYWKGESLPNDKTLWIHWKDEVFEHLKLSERLCFGFDKPFATDYEEVACGDFNFSFTHRHDYIHNQHDDKNRITLSCGKVLQPHHITAKARLDAAMTQKAYFFTTGSGRWPVKTDTPSNRDCKFELSLEFLHSTPDFPSTPFGGTLEIWEGTFIPDYHNQHRKQNSWRCVSDESFNDMAVMDRYGSTFKLSFAGVKGLPVGGRPTIRLPEGQKLSAADIFASYAPGAHLKLKKDALMGDSQALSTLGKTHREMDADLQEGIKRYSLHARYRDIRPLLNKCEKETCNHNVREQIDYCLRTVEETEGRIVFREQQEGIIRYLGGFNAPHLAMVMKAIAKRHTGYSNELHVYGKMFRANTNRLQPMNQTQKWWDYDTIKSLWQELSKEYLPTRSQALVTILQATNKDLIPPIDGSVKITILPPKDGSSLYDHTRVHKMPDYPTRRMRTSKDKLLGIPGVEAGKTKDFECPGCTMEDEANEKVLQEVCMGQIIYPGNYKEKVQALKGVKFPYPDRIVRKLRDLGVSEADINDIMFVDTPVTLISTKPYTPDHDDIEQMRGRAKREQDDAKNVECVGSGDPDTVEPYQLGRSSYEALREKAVADNCVIFTAQQQPTVDVEALKSVDRILSIKAKMDELNLPYLLGGKGTPQAIYLDEMDKAQKATGKPIIFDMERRLTALNALIDVARIHGLGPNAVLPLEELKGLHINWGKTSWSGARTLASFSIFCRDYPDIEVSAKRMFEANNPDLADKRDNTVAWINSCEISEADIAESYKKLNVMEAETRVRGEASNAVIIDYMNPEQARDMAMGIAPPVDDIRSSYNLNAEAVLTPLDENDENDEYDNYMDSEAASIAAGDGDYLRAGFEAGDTQYASPDEIKGMCADLGIPDIDDHGMKIATNEEMKGFDDSMGSFDLGSSHPAQDFSLLDGYGIPEEVQNPAHFVVLAGGDHACKMKDSMLEQTVDLEASGVTFSNNCMDFLDIEVWEGSKGTAEGERQWYHRITYRYHTLTRVSGDKYRYARIEEIKPPVTLTVKCFGPLKASDIGKARG